MRLRKSKDIVIHNENDGYVVLNMTNGNFYGLYEVGRIIWEEIDKVSFIDKIIDNVKLRYENTSNEIIAVDVKLFIKDLIGEGLIEVYE